MWGFRKQKRGPANSRPAPTLGASEASQAVTALAVTIALDIVKAVHPAVFPADVHSRQSLPREVWPTAKEGVAFALTVADRYTFDIAGDDGRDAIMTSAVSQTIGLIGSVFGYPEDRERTFETLDEIGREYGGLESLFPGEGRPRPSVLEAAHQRILATGPAEQDADYQAGILLAIMTAVSNAKLRDAISASWAPR